MKNKSLRSMLKLSWLMLAMFVAFTACKDDEPKPDPVLVEDGFYVFGEGTALTDYDFKGLMKITRNEVVQEDRSNLMELFISVKAGSEGFNIAHVAGGEAVVYGPGSDFAEITGEDLDGEEPNQGLWKGSYVETTTPFTVPEDALYHVIIDTELEVVAVAKVIWGVIGAATPGGWSTSTALNATFGLESMQFSGTEIAMSKSEFKFRYSNGWKIILDNDYDLGDGKQGIKVNTNLGGTIAELVPGGPNINVEESGLYTINVNWTVEDGTSVSLTKTGDIQITDWSDVIFDVFGNGVDENNQGAVADPSSWGWGYALAADGAPTVDGDVAEGAIFTYIWTEVALNPAENEGFAFRSVVGEEYNGTVLRYSAIDEENSDMDVVTSATNGFGDVNFDVTEAGNYDIYLTIDASKDDQASVKIVKSGAVVRPATYYDLVGDAVSADNVGAIDDAIWPWGRSMISDNNGEITGTTVTWTDAILLEDGMKIRKIVNNGVDSEFNMSKFNAAGSTAGIVSGDNDIIVDVAGTYTIVLDLDAGTFTIN